MLYFLPGKDNNGGNTKYVYNPAYLARLQDNETAIRQNIREIAILKGTYNRIYV